MEILILQSSIILYFSSSDVIRSEGCTTDVCDEAAEKNQLRIVQWLYANRTEGCTATVMDDAAANCNFELVKWIHENTTAECSHKVMDEAARWGRLDILRWLRENRTEGCTSTAMNYAAKRWVPGDTSMASFELCNVLYAGLRNK
ncbi:hypothetical protein JG687_00019673 [Phytophthora cactorum]|uniref:Ankyrin repeat-containing domain n=1 Tax=Phytophthora cactorum TaxID=29920 RepID=A0A8T1TLJ2_9STRA|nr:hypothetical protein JG687_00019673 [Phytophthora cactorum]